MPLERKKLPDLIELAGKVYGLGADTLEEVPTTNSPHQGLPLDWDTKEALAHAAAEKRKLARVGWLMRAPENFRGAPTKVSMEDLNKHSLLFDPAEVPPPRRKYSGLPEKHRDARVRVFERMTGRKAMKLPGGSYLIRALLAAAALSPLLSQMRSNSDSD